MVAAHLTVAALDNNPALNVHRTRIAVFHHGVVLGMTFHMAVTVLDLDVDHHAVAGRHGFEILEQLLIGRFELLDPGFQRRDALIVGLCKSGRGNARDSQRTGASP